MPRPKKKKYKDYKDIYDFIANAPDDDFNIKQMRVAEMDLKLGGWMIQERLKARGYMRL